MAQFRIHVPQFRSLPDPAGGPGKVGLFYAPAREMPREFTNWRDVNPRDVKESSWVFKAIKATLEDEPARFAERNRGLTISAADVSYDEKKREVVLTLDDPSVHGIVDGGHTLQAILQVQPQLAEENWPAEVFVKVVTGISPNQIAEIAGGLNSSQQVDLKSLENLQQHFGPLQKAIETQPYAEKIAYKMNDPRPIDVREVLYYMAIFDCGQYSEDRHPTALFGRKEGIVRNFADDAKESFKGSWGILTSKAPEILRLRDLLEKRALAFDIGRHKVAKGVRVRSPKFSKNTLYFLDEQVEGKIPLGWLMPMLGGFRANVTWDEPKRSFTWKVPNEELLEKCIGGLVQAIKEIHERENAKPEYVGRSATAWRMCYDCVRMAILEHQLAQMRKKA